MAKKSEMESLLSARSLTTLRKGFDRQTLNDIAAARLIAPYPAGGELPAAILTHFFPVTGGAIGADDRERIILALLAAQGADDGQIAIHVYWGLMEGLTVADVMESLLLAGYYAGIFRYQRCLGIVRTTLLALEAQPARKSDVRSVLSAIMGRLAEP